MSRALRAGILAALAALVLDQASKLWLLYVFDLGRRGVVQVTPFFDLWLAWNVGISFGWFQNDSFLAQAVLTTIKAVAVIVLAIWMARSHNWLATVAPVGEKIPVGREDDGVAFDFRHSHQTSIGE